MPRRRSTNSLLIMPGEGDRRKILFPVPHQHRALNRVKYVKYEVVNDRAAQQGKDVIVRLVGAVIDC